MLIIKLKVEAYKSVDIDNIARKYNHTMSQKEKIELPK